MRDSSVICRPADRDLKPILFIVEIQLLLGAGSASGSMDAANILKPALARGAIRVVGATTIREYPVLAAESRGASVVVFKLPDDAGLFLVGVV